MIINQGQKQLNAIGKISLDNTKVIDFYNGADKRLKDLVDRARKETDENESGDKSFVVPISGKTFHFSKCINLSRFGSKIFTNKLSLNKAKIEQKRISSLIDDLEKKFGPDRSGRPLTENNKKKTRTLTKDVK